MKHINFSNVEQLIFENQEIQKLLPPYMFSYFEQWKLGKRIPMLRQVGKQALLDLLDHLDDGHVQILEDYFNERVIVERLNYHIVQNIKVPIADAQVVCDHLCRIDGFNYYSTWRDENHLYLSFWR